eukprot:671240-Hanusia_phi.AAC.1
MEGQQEAADGSSGMEGQQEAEEEESEQWGVGVPITSRPTEEHGERRTSEESLQRLLALARPLLSLLLVTRSRQAE